MDDAITLSDLSVVRGRPVLENITAEIPAGTITGLLGPSGSGKTTLMRAIVGVQKITGGTGTVLGLPIGSADLRRRVGYVSQAASVYEDLTVADNIRYFAALYPHSRGIDSVIATVGLSGYADTRVTALSGGQRSRVSLACALTGRPDVLVLDEPTVGLDPVLRVDLWQTFERLASEGTTLLVSSHVLDEAAHCSRLILLREGRLLADTTTAELKSRTGTDDLDEAFLRLITQRDDVPDGAPTDGRDGARDRPVEPGRGRHRADGVGQLEPDGAPRSGADGVQQPGPDGVRHPEAVTFGIKFGTKSTARTGQHR